jgi:hypothetical protein
MLSLCGEVNPGVDREFARKFTVISSLNRIRRFVKQASGSELLAKLPETYYVTGATAVRQTKRNC